VEEEERYIFLSVDAWSRINSGGEVERLIRELLTEKETLTDLGGA
jgi:hypothetical protein